MRDVFLVPRVVAYGRSRVSTRWCLPVGQPLAEHDTSSRQPLKWTKGLLETSDLILERDLLCPMSGGP